MTSRIYSLASFKFEQADELSPEAWETPGFPTLLPTTAADPADAVAAPDAPWGSANELVLGRPLPLISDWKCAEAGGRWSAVPSTTWPGPGWNIGLKTKRWQTFCRDPQRSPTLSRAENTRSLMGNAVRAHCRFTILILTKKKNSRSRCHTPECSVLPVCTISYLCIIHNKIIKLKN